MLDETGHKAGQQVKPLDVWYRIVKKTLWKTTKDVKAQFGSASFLEDNIVVFNIAGNKYRLVTRVFYQVKRVYILFVFTHKEYDDWNGSRQ